MENDMIDDFAGMHSFFSDAYKDEHGFRPRGEWSSTQMDAYFKGRPARIASQDAEKLKEFQTDVKQHKGLFKETKDGLINQDYKGFYKSLTAVRKNDFGSGIGFLLFYVTDGYAKGGFAIDECGDIVILETCWHQTFTGSPEEFYQRLLKKLS